MSFINAFNISKYIKRIGDGFNAKIGHVNSVIEMLPQYAEITVTDINELITTDAKNGGIIALPAPGENKYYDIVKIAIECITPDGVAIFSGENEDSLSYFNIVALLSGSTIVGWNIDNVIAEGVFYAIDIPVFGLDKNIGGTINTFTSSTNLINKPLKFLINDHDDTDFPSPHTFVGETTITFKIWYNIMTAGSNIE